MSALTTVALLIITPLPEVEILMSEPWAVVALLRLTLGNTLSRHRVSVE